MTNKIQQLIKSSGFILCPVCNGEGEVGYFCGHDSSAVCEMCNGDGIVRSLKKQVYNEDSRIPHKTLRCLNFSENKISQFIATILAVNKVK